MSGGDVQKSNTPDPEDEHLKENVVQKMLPEYYQSIQF